MFRSEPFSMPMSASVVIPTTMRRATTAAAVASALAAVNRLEGGEVIVVANGPREGRRRLELRSPLLRVLESPEARPASARNLGLREAANNVVLFTDDDCLMPAEWPERLASRLRTDAAAVATPVEVRREGPVTSFLDYQRIFDPRPLDASTVGFGIGASLGIRRDLVDVVFDERMMFGDDVEFGYSLRDRGIPTVYVPEAGPLVHLLPESLESITERFHRYGRSNAILSLGGGRTGLSVPRAAPLYTSLLDNRVLAPRRFEELADPEVRMLFATCDLIQLGSFLVGYLSGAGEILRRKIIDVDREALERGWDEIEATLEPARPDRDWGMLPVDLGRLATAREGKRPALAAEIGRHLSRSAGLVGGTAANSELDWTTGEIEQRNERTRRRSNAVWAEVRQGALVPEVDPVARRLRDVGVAYREGMHMIEASTQGPVEPATLLAVTA
jgi:GT2 family glycosyltransferase